VFLNYFFLISRITRRAQLGPLYRLSMGLVKVAAPPRRALLGALGAVVFLLLLSALDSLTRGALRLPALVPPFGASVAIVFFTPESPLGKAWNVTAGHVLSALCASAVVWLLPQAPPMLLVSLAVPGAVLLMLATRSFHPPGGATALLAAIAQPKLGFSMVLCPMLAGTLLLVAVRFSLDRSLAVVLQRRAKLEAALGDLPAVLSTSLRSEEP
jgi:CBS domain-containing membrane protein